MKLCRHCNQGFEPVRSMQFVCCWQCALADARRKAALAPYKPRRLKAVGKDARAIETASQAADKAQKVFNRWVRLRDAGKPCVSCGKPDIGERHASHFRNQGPHPALRFEPDNVHASCVRCNKELSGNKTAYRAELINRIGLERVEWLEGPHELPHRTVEQIREINKHYANLARCLERERAA